MDSPPEPPALPPADVPPSLPPVTSSTVAEPAPAQSAPADTVVLELPTTPPPLGHEIRFHGAAKEYFRIWIVNTLLTLLTGGVFLAWAKVRKRRYLRGCVELMGHRFDYRANPLQLLLGNVMVALLFLGYSVFGAVYPAVQVGVFVVGVLLIPWIVTRAFCFNAHNTVYRELRFRFHGALSSALAVYLLKPIFIGLTFGLYYPAWVRERRLYAVNNHRLGDAYFRLKCNTGPFYRAYLVAGAVALVALVTAGAFITWSQNQTSGAPSKTPLLIGFFVIYGLGFFVSKQLIHAQLFNHIWNHTSLDGHRFEAQMKVGRWLSLQATNLLAVIGSAGLLLPWATIRTCRYTASCLRLVPNGPLETIERMGSANGSGAGESAAEVIGLDFGL